MLCKDYNEPLPATAATRRLCDVPQSVKCGRFTEALQCVNPLPTFFVSLGSGVI